MRRPLILLLWLTCLSLGAQTAAVVQEGLGDAVVFSTDNPARRTVVKLGEKPHEIELTPDGSMAYVSNFGLLEANHKDGAPGTTISVVDLVHRTERGRFQLPEGFTAPHGLKLRPPGFRELFTNAEEGRGGMVVFNAESGVVLRTFPLPSGLHNFLFNSEGSALFGFSVKGEVYRLDPDTGNVIAKTATGSPRGLCWSADRRLLVVGDKSQIVLLDPSDLSVVNQIANLGVGQIFYPAATPDGRWILAPAVLDGVVLVVDAHTGSAVARIQTGSPLTIALDPDQKHAWISNVRIPAGLFGPSTTARDGGLVLLDLTTFKTKKIDGIPDTNGLAISSNQFNRSRKN